MKKRKILSLVLTGLMLSSTFLIGCGQKKVADDSKATNTKVETPAPKVDKILNYYLGDEPETLDGQQMTGAPDLLISNMFMEGLARYGKEEGKYVPGVAKEWKYDTTANKYTFTLRDDAKWMDGTPVTAKDFVYGWKLALDGNSQYAGMITDYIAGTQQYFDLTEDVFYASKDANYKTLLGQRDAEKDAAKKKDLSSKVEEAKKALPKTLVDEYIKTKADLWSKVGIKESSNTLELTLSAPCPYFIGLVAFSVYNPVNQKFHESHLKSKDYTLEASGLNSNGPWIVKDWKHKDSISLEKNPNYWNNKEIKIDKVNIKIVIDVATRTNLLKTGAIDGSAIQSSDLKIFQDKAVRDQHNLQDMIDMPDYTIFYLEFNFINNPITMNVNIRRAIALAMDRKGLVDKISIGDEPALAVIPGYFPGLNKSFRDENGKILIQDHQVDKAKEYLKQGLTELKLDKLPAQDMLVGTGDVSMKIAQKTQSDLKEVGIDVNIVPVTWGDKLQRLKSGNFGICSSGWGPDYMDPMTYLNLFQSTNGNNHGKYTNPKYDDLINNAYKETDAAKRMGYFYDAEKILVNDMVVAPEYNRIAHWVFKDYLTGVINRGSGPATDFYYADVDMTKKLADKK